MHIRQAFKASNISQDAPDLPKLSADCFCIFDEAAAGSAAWRQLPLFPLPGSVAFSKPLFYYITVCGLCMVHGVYFIFFVLGIMLREMGFDPARVQLICSAVYFFLIPGLS